jgi:hypothetical protein
MGTNPEYYDSKMVTKGEGRAVTRVVSEDGLVVKVNLMVTRKDFESFGYISSRRKWARGELLFAKCKCVILELERDGEGWFDMKWLEDEIIAII